MFLDGVINANVAKQYANGIGSFFSLQECNCPNGAYVGHPPLAFAMQATTLKACGSAFYMDKVHSLLCAVAQLLLIGVLWLKAVPQHKLKKLVWLPCLLWLLSPIISWGYSSNLLENTMSMFTTATLIVMLAFMRGGKLLWLYAIVAALLSFAALLSKGPVAMFVLAAPIVFVGTYEDYNLRKALSFMAVYLTALTLLALAIWVLPEGNSYIRAYFEAQLIPSLNPSDASVIARLRILPFLLKALLPILVIVIAAYGATKTKWLNNIKVDLGNKAAYRFLILGLCATLPIMLSNKQSAFYVIPAIPVFAIGFALIIAEVVSILMDKYRASILHKAIGWLSLVAITGMVSVSVCNYGSMLRDGDMLTDAEQIHDLLQGDNVIADPLYQFVDEYQLKAYLNRLYSISVHNDMPNKWYLIKPETTLPEKARIIYKGKTLSVYTL